MGPTHPHVASTASRSSAPSPARKRSHIDDMDPAAVNFDKTCVLERFQRALHDFAH